MPFPVSIIIPAYNAAVTLAETLASLQSQTHRDWEAIVVENGSTDSTAALAEQFAAHDPRIRLVQSPLKGVSRARNLGLRLAHHDWVLFLDADDWILPNHLEALTAVLAANPTLDAVHCGWRRVNPEGIVMFEEYGPDEPDLFPLFARTCLFAIHACVVRRARVMEVGGFDESLRTCEDWDLWQRIARAGGRFALKHEVLAGYRARPLSASMDGRQMLTDGFLVIARAFAPDPRVPHPHAPYAQGLPANTHALARLENLIWQAGLMLGAGAEAVDLFEAIAGDPIARLSPDTAASSLFEAALLPTARAPDAWWRLLLWILPQLEKFLQALENHTRHRGLARAMLVNLERRAVAPHTVPLPLTIGHTHAIAVELTTPFAQLALPVQIERIHCRVELEGQYLGSLELPVFDGVLPADVLADAIAADFAWPILGRFFTRNLYPQLQVERDAQGWTVRRDGVVLAQGLPGLDEISWEAAHDQIGWTLFVQEAWGLKAAPDGRFYALRHAERRPNPVEPERPAAESFTIDLLDPVKDHRLDHPAVDLTLTVADMPVARTPLVVPKRRLSADMIRAALMAESGFELCCACVREALLQRPLADGSSLRARLAQARARRSLSSPTDALAATAALKSRDATPRNGSDENHPQRVLWPRHPHAPCGTSASRRAVLPRAVLPELERLVNASGETLVSSPLLIGSERIVSYVPELWGQLPGDHRRGAEPLVHELRSPSHEISPSQRLAPWRRWLSRLAPRANGLEPRPPSTPVAPPRLAASTRAVRPDSAQTQATRRLPILMYHRIATEGPPALARYRTAPAQFEAQLRFLRENGYTSTTFEEWRAAREVKRPLPGKRVLLTFDDACTDFIASAWPLLQRYGFGAAVFVPTDEVGGSCRWDAALGEPAPVMSWSDLRALRAAGVELGSHTASHPLLTGLSTEAMAREALRSSAVLAEELGAAVTSIAYPYGAFDRVVESVFGGAGYLFGVTCDHRCCETGDRLLALPRIEVAGGMTIEQFQTALSY